MYAADVSLRFTRSLPTPSACFTLDAHNAACVQHPPGQGSGHDTCVLHTFPAVLWLAPSPWCWGPAVWPHRHSPGMSRAGKGIGTVIHSEAPAMKAETTGTIAVATGKEISPTTARASTGKGAAIQGVRNPGCPSRSIRRSRLMTCAWGRGQAPSTATIGATGCRPRHVSR